MKQRYIPVAHDTFGIPEIWNIIKVAISRRWTDGKYCDMFENKIKKFLNRKHVILCNSGSSANYLAVAGLISSGKLKVGDEVITTALCFPTTVNPLIQLGLIPVFIDVDLNTLNANIEQIKKAYNPKKTKAIMLAHTLGNAFDLKFIKQFCHDNYLYLISDCCDALLTYYDNNPVGHYGDLTTFSFYPAHHISSAEGGAVATDNDTLAKTIRSLRDWGRSCTCHTGHDNECGNRFGQKIEGLPEGYDHKYIYGNIGYNLKMTDLQACIGVAQMDRLDYIKSKRILNYLSIEDLLKDNTNFDILLLKSDAVKGNVTCPFGLTIILNERVDKTGFVKYLEANKIGTRPVFAGNILRHPAYRHIQYKNKMPDDNNTDYIMEHGLWIGCHTKINKKEIDYIVKTINNYFKQNDLPKYVLPKKEIKIMKRYAMGIIKLNKEEIL